MEKEVDEFLTTLSQVATLGIEIDASGHRESFVTHLIRENRGRERERWRMGEKKKGRARGVD